MMPVPFNSSSIGCNYYEIKVPFKTTDAFNSTMIASFLPVIVSKTNKQTEKNMPFIAMFHKFT